MSNSQTADREGHGLGYTMPQLEHALYEWRRIMAREPIYIEDCCFNWIRDSCKGGECPCRCHSEAGPQPDEMVRIQQALDATEEEVARLQMERDAAERERDQAQALAGSLSEDWHRLSKAVERYRAALEQIAAHTVEMSAQDGDDPTTSAFWIVQDIAARALDRYQQEDDDELIGEALERRRQPENQPPRDTLIDEGIVPLSFRWPSK